MRQHRHLSRRQQIIDAALRVFASKGFEKATNRDIAQEAGIKSPGLIYHYFKDKADLFRQVAEERAPALQLISRGDELMDLPPRRALTRLGMSFVKTFSDPMAAAMLKMMLGEAVRRPVVAELFNSIGPGRGFALLTRYLEHQMDLGVLRRTHPGAAARCFVGPLIAYVLTREVFVQPDSTTLSPEAMVETAVDTFLRGMEVRTSEQS
jgi:AcrR family transcriptional regulator